MNIEPIIHIFAQKELTPDEQRTYIAMCSMVREWYRLQELAVRAQADALQQQADEQTEKELNASRSTSVANQRRTKKPKPPESCGESGV